MVLGRIRCFVAGEAAKMNRRSNRRTTQKTNSKYAKDTSDRIRSEYTMHCHDWWKNLEEKRGQTQIVGVRGESPWPYFGL